MNDEISFLTERRSDFERLMQEQTRRRTRSGLSFRGFALAIACVGATLAAFFVGTLTTHPATPASADTVIGQIAQTFATRMGDPTPTQEVYASSTRGVANQETGSGGGTSPIPVYLVAMRGNFTDTTAHTPSAGDDPTGTVLTLVIAQSDYQVLDLGVSDQWPNLTNEKHVQNVN